MVLTVLAAASMLSPIAVQNGMVGNGTGMMGSNGGMVPMANQNQHMPGMVPIMQQSPQLPAMQGTVTTVAFAILLLLPIITWTRHLQIQQTFFVWHVLLLIMLLETRWIRHLQKQQILCCACSVVHVLFEIRLLLACTDTRALMNKLL